jgi:hypothetical protein
MLFAILLYRNSFEIEETEERGFSGEINKTLIPMFEFLTSCDFTSGDLILWEKALIHLMGSKSELQKSAWEFLFSKRKNKLKGFK